MYVVLIMPCIGAFSLRLLCMVFMGSFRINLDLSKWISLYYVYQDWIMEDMRSWKVRVTNFAMKESFNLHNRSHEGSGILAVHLLMYWNILPHTFWIAFHKLDWCDEYFLCIRFLHNSTVGQWLCWPLNFRQNTSFFSKYWSWVFGSFLVILCDGKEMYTQVHISKYV